jgi:hypothetical protein
MRRTMPISGLSLGSCALLLCAAAAQTQTVLSPVGRPIGDPIRVEVTDTINPVYMRIQFTVRELRNVAALRIVDKTARRELHRWTRAEFGPKLEGAAPDTPVTFAKNLTFRRAEARPQREIFVETVNERDHPVRVTTFRFDVKPHPSEELAAQESYQIFFDIAQIDFQDACREGRERFSLRAGIFIGEEEQEFPSLRQLTQIQTRESLRGYLEGCVAAYTKCLGGAGDRQAQRVQSFCTEQRDQLRRDVFGGR